MNFEKIKIIQDKLRDYTWWKHKLKEKPHANVKVHFEIILKALLHYPFLYLLILTWTLALIHKSTKKTHSFFCLCVSIG